MGHDELVELLQRAEAIVREALPASHLQEAAFDFVLHEVWVAEHDVEVLDDDAGPSVPRMQVELVAAHRVLNAAGAPKMAAGHALSVPARIEWLTGRGRLTEVAITGGDDPTGEPIVLP
ncbi:MAG TPA: hypothetical protein VGX21_13230 [Methylomirabilota bacterium]|jgi:hypothetical protein|nr:hypothetical protein [Methylomirabilota bacterium]